MTHMACIEDDETGRMPEEAERPSCVVVIPETTRPPCVWCGRTGSRRRRRGLCIACARKFSESEVELPEVARPSQPGPRPRDPLLWLMDRLTPSQRDKARLYLGELASREPDPTP